MKHHGDLHILIGDERLLARAMTLGASGAISGMLKVIPDLMQKLLDGIEEPRVNAMVDVVLGYPVTAAVKALVGLSNLMADAKGRIASIDVNPFLINPKTGVAVDALVVLNNEAAKKSAAEHH